MMSKKRIGSGIATLGATLALVAGSSLMPAEAANQVTPATVSAASVSDLIRSSQPTELNPFLVGAGVSDITGEVAEVGFIGYGTATQKGSGLHTRQYARAFVVIDPVDGQRNLIVVLDALSGWGSLREALVDQIRAEFGPEFSEANIMITASHTHATPGGVSKDALYNITTLGFHKATFDAQVTGSMRAIRQALADLAPGNVTVSQSELTGVGVNRSAVAQRQDPPELLRMLTDGVDPSSTTFRFEHNGVTRAVLNWYAVHATSLTNQNTLVSSDNKGYAEYLLETVDHGVDLNQESDQPDFVAAFANSSAGDVSPNTWLKPGMGPTDDQFENLKIQGSRQADAVRQQLANPGVPLGRGLDSRITYTDFSSVNVSQQFTGTGYAGRTCNASLGAPFAAGSVEDGPGADGFNEGVNANKVWSGFNWLAYSASSDLTACQYPKANLLAVHQQIQQKLPVQVMRFGDYYLLGMPGELTSAVGAQYRQDMAELFGVDVSHIIVQGYTNAYSHYVTTPQEYVTQQYEGGATVFGINEMGAFRQVLQTVGSSLKEGRELNIGDKPLMRKPMESTVGKVWYDSPGWGNYYGKVLAQPRDTHAGGQVSALFVGAHPNNNHKLNATYLEVQRKQGDSWVRVAADNDPNTKFHWRRHWAAQSRVSIEWQVPEEALPGTYRLVYYGDSKQANGKITPFTGTSREFKVS
ncbi:neutral/alkaline non-lysosomal ceramidase N-terminal domain-containing protein [Rothia sp. P5766]|uniref:neutral/alkaline non-lysosomal ceramidase N-terminal domain-containing protein n=1 Tax=unclassified Rothia (in: high G+C Gram-positive bacteria) TaxID=2689056 RepID=UPI003AE72051